MTALLDRIRRFVRQHGLFGTDTRLVVALSGGSDSVALLHLLHDLQVAGEVHLAGAAHFNHQLRDLADRDEACAAAAARSLDVPFTADRGDVRARARLGHLSIETAARACRYEFFDRARRLFAADVVALGHTRDDQAETFLLRLVRGAGPRGLSGMSAARGTIVRPLLECGRQELRAYLGERRVSYVDDESNLDTRIPRNRVRAELLPLLEHAFNPGIVETLAREADLSREMYEWLDGLADALLAEMSSGVRNSDFRLQTSDFRREASDLRLESWELDVALLKGAPPPVARFAIWKAMTKVGAGRAVSSAQVASALALLSVDRGSIDGPGQRMERIGGKLVLTGSRPRSLENLGNSGNPGNPSNLFEYPLSIPGEARLGEGIGVLSAEPLAPESGVPEGTAATGRGPSAWVRADACTPPLVVRNRRPGDRFRPIGVGGQKKVQDYFVDRKVARSSRDQVPLVVDGRGRIVWVAGFGIDEAFRVTDASQSVLLLRLRQV